jgi:hypothetical protein
MKRRGWLASLPLIAVAVIVFAYGGCGGGSDTTSTEGTIQVSLTDAPGLEYDNVIITVSEVWFHTSDAAGPGTAGWLKYPLSSPTAVDLAHLTNGTISTILNQTLPVGHYQQIRLLLKPPENGLPWPNKIIVGGVTYPLHIPDAKHGIKLNGTFQIVAGQTLHIAIDFDVAHDIVKVNRGGHIEFILKPRLRYFDLSRAGSIAGSIDAATRSAGSLFVFKAEQLEAGAGLDNTYKTRRFTTVGYHGDDTAFFFAFLPAGNYDIVMRGRGVETVIVRNVPVVEGQTTNLGPEINMPAGSEFTANTQVSPTGSWITFYQTLDKTATGEAVEYPYEIRFRHINPLTGAFFEPIPLSNGPIRFGKYNNSQAISFQTITPLEFTGGGANAGFTAKASAFGFESSAMAAFDNTTAGPSFPARLSVKSTLGSFTASGKIANLPKVSLELDNVVILVAHGGLIVDTFWPTATQGPMQWDGNPSHDPTYTTPSLPGGFSSAFYGIDGMGWSTSPVAFAIGIPTIADLRFGNDTTADFTMVGFSLPSP